MMIRITNFIKKKLKKCRDKTSMTNEVKIYAYKLSITEGNIKVEEIEFSVIEKQKIFSLKQEGDNTSC